MAAAEEAANDKEDEIFGGHDGAGNNGGENTIFDLAFHPRHLERAMFISINYMRSVRAIFVRGNLFFTNFNSVISFLLDATELRKRDSWRVGGRKLR